jgi:hypothetical protein
MPHREQPADGVSKITEKLKSLEGTKRSQVVIALICFVLPMLLALTLLRHRESTWQNTGLPGIAVEELVESQGTLFVASTQGIFRSEDGVSWQPINRGLPLGLLAGIDVRTLVVDPTNPALAFALIRDENGDGHLYRTTSGGEVWEKMALPADPSILDALVLFPGDPVTLYVAGGQKVYESVDGGQAWSHRGLVPQGTDPRTLAADTQSKGTLYLGTADDGVFLSANGGRSWKPMNTGLSAQPVRQLIVNPVADQLVFVLTGDGVYRSVDGGQNWQFAGPDVAAGEITVLAAHPSRPGVLYAGTAKGQVLFTADAGDDWKSLGAQLKDAVVRALVPEQKRVRVATSQGLWQFDLDLPPKLTPPTTIVAMVSTPTPTATPLPTPTATPTASPTATPTPTLPPTATSTPTFTPTPTATPRPTSRPPTATALPSPTPTATPLPTPSPAPTATSTPLPPPTNTPRPTTGPPTTVPTPTPTPLPTATPTITPGGPRPTPPGGTPPPTFTPTPSVTPTLLPTATATPTLLPTTTATITPTLVPTETPEPSLTPSVTPTAMPTVTATATTPPSSTVVITVTLTPAITATPSPALTTTPTSTSSPEITPASPHTPMPSPQPTLLTPVGSLSSGTRTRWPWDGLILVQQ